MADFVPAMHFMSYLSTVILMSVCMIRLDKDKRFQGILMPHPMSVIPVSSCGHWWIA